MLTLSLALVRAFLIPPDVPSRDGYTQLFHTATPDLHMDRSGAVVKRRSMRDEPGLIFAYVLAVGWLVSYGYHLWEKSLPVDLPCRLGIHGCAPHALCQLEWHGLAMPTCEAVEARLLPRGHPPVPTGAGLCSAALESTTTWLRWVACALAVAFVLAAAAAAFVLLRRRAPREFTRIPPTGLDAWIAEHVRTPTGKRPGARDPGKGVHSNGRTKSIQCGVKQ